MAVAVEEVEVVADTQKEVIENTTKETTTTNSGQMGRIVKGVLIQNNDDSKVQDIPIVTNKKGGESTQLTTIQKEQFKAGTADLILTDENGNGVRINQSSFKAEELESYFGI